MSTNSMLHRFLIEAKIVEVRDIISRFSSINIIIPLSSTLLITFIPDCTRKVKNRKRRTLKGILRVAKRGCITTTQDNPEILKNPLYTIYLTKEDLMKISNKDEELIKIIYETFNT